MVSDTAKQKSLFPYIYNIHTYIYTLHHNNYYYSLTTLIFPQNVPI